jgi:hypothetical protein
MIPCGLVDMYRRFRRTCCIIMTLMTEAVSSPETSVHIYQPKIIHIPENSNTYKVILDVEMC